MGAGRYSRQLLIGWNVHIADHAVLAHAGYHRLFERSGQSSEDTLLFGWANDLIGCGLVVPREGQVTNLLYYCPVPIPQVVIHGEVPIGIERLAVSAPHGPTNKDLIARIELWQNKQFWFIIRANLIQSHCWFGHKNSRNIASIALGYRNDGHQQFFAYL